MISNHLSGESRFRTPRLLAEHGIQRAINVIIRSEKVPFGVLEVDSPVEGRFTQFDTAFLQSFSSLLGGAIDRLDGEQALRDSEIRLQTSLAHQEVLTREISHRVKNSLAIVASILSMQSQHTGNSELSAGLMDARTRVLTIAKVHDQLWRSSEIHRLEASVFLKGLCEQLREATGLGDQLICDCDEFSIETDRAISLGLIANELVTNAYKYAYSNERGEIQVSAKAMDGSRIRFQVCDRGGGLPNTFDPNGSTSLGMKMIKHLSRQIAGVAEWQDAQPGTRFVLEFANGGDRTP